MLFLKFIFLVYFFHTSQIQAKSLDDLYIKTYGNPNKAPIIFVHGGPGYNSLDFELTTASKLADLGHFVIVYDQRGQGRSKEASEDDFTYKTYADDLKAIIDQYHLEKPTLIGHSHGGPIAIRFDQFYPNIAAKIVLVSAPLYFSGVFNAIYENAARFYTSANDPKNLAELSFLKANWQFNPNLSAEEKVLIIARTFQHARQSGLYYTSRPNAEAQDLRALLHAHPIENPTGVLTAMPAFLKNEDYTQVNLLNWVFENRNRYCGIYGAEDGLFSPIELGIIRNALTSSNRENFKIIQEASHSIFIDQQAEFLQNLRTICL